MAGSLNRVQLLGNVGKDPEIRSTNDGRRIANFSIATAETWRDKTSGEKREKTEWHRVVVFSDGLVGVVEKYVTKGSKIYVEGAIQTRKWTDQQGQERYSTEVVLNGFNSQLILLGSPNGGGRSQGDAYEGPTDSGSSGSGSGGGSGGGGRPTTNDLDDEIPFFSNELSLDPAFRKHKIVA